MNEKLKIYTCGRMSGIPFQKQMAWRRNIEHLIRNRLSFSGKDATFVHPPLYYNYDEERHYSEREIMEWELSQVRDCDILIVNIDGLAKSIGSHFEMAMAYAVNHFGGKHISVIGINENNEEMHPWIKESFLRVEDSLSDAADYIVDYLII